MEPILPEWPATLTEYLRKKYREPSTIMPLSGLSHNAIWKVCYGARCVIVKKTVEPKEINFYRGIAPELATQGVLIPALEWSEARPESNWCVLEYIPNALPRERWLGDPQVLRVLHRLHHSIVSVSPDMDWLFYPEWSETMSEQAMTFFPVEVAKSLNPVVRSLQMISKPLFERRCWISGDPNPANWGVREDNSVVLFDWERFGRGTAALDVTITVPGFPTPAQFDLVAARYLENDATPPDSQRVTGFAREIALAKVWNIVEFLSMAHLGQVGNMSIIPPVIEYFPGWLKTIEEYIKRN